MKSKTKSLMLFIILTLTTTGCLSWFQSDESGNPTSNISDAMEIIDKSGDAVADTSKSIADSADKIDKSVDNIEDNVPDDVVPKVKPDIDKVKTETKGLRKDSQDLALASERMKDAQGELHKALDEAAKADNKIKSLQKELDDEKTKSAALLRKAMVFVICLGIVLAAIGAALFAQGNVKATAMGIAGIVIVAIGLGVSFFGKSIAIAGVGVIVLPLGFLAYMVIADRKKNRRIQKSEQATKEIVHTMEVVKENLKQEDRKKIFGYKSVPGIASSIQSKETEEEVRGIRESYKGAWEPTVAPSKS